MTRDQTGAQEEEYTKLKEELVARFGIHSATLLEREVIQKWKGDSLGELYGMAISAAKNTLNPSSTMDDTEYNEIMSLQSLFDVID